MSEIRWAVLRNQFPFGIGDLVGHVHANNKATALERAQAIHGTTVVVQSVASLKVGATEKPLPKPDPTRDRYGLKKRPYKPHGLVKARGPHDPRGPRPKPMGELSRVEGIGGDS
jgi:hypothetical protein